MLCRILSWELFFVTLEIRHYGECPQSIPRAEEPEEIFVRAPPERIYRARVWVISAARQHVASVPRTS